MDEKQCLGCGKFLFPMCFRNSHKTNPEMSICDSCLKTGKRISCENILWTKYPELKKVAYYRWYPCITIQSKTKVEFRCKKCNHYIEISPVEFLKLPYCTSCGNCFLQRKTPVNDIIIQTEKFILNSTNYLSFTDKIKNLPLSDKWDVREMLAKYYFESHRKHYGIEKYFSRLLGDTIPDDLLLDNKNTADGTILYTTGKISLVQVKYRSDISGYLQRECIGGLSLEDLGWEDKFECMYLFDNSVFSPKSCSHESKKVRYIGNNELQRCEWALIQEWVKSNRQEYPSSFYTAKKLLNWQKKAKKSIFSRDGGFSRMFGRKNIMVPIGPEKIVLGNFVLNSTRKKYDKCLVVVPYL